MIAPPRRAFAWVLLVLAVAILALDARGAAQGGRTPRAHAQQRSPATDIEGPRKVTVRDLPAAAEAAPARKTPLRRPASMAAGAAGAAETAAPNVLAPATVPAVNGPHFAGLDNGANSINLTPPDPQIAVGPNHVMEMMNVAARIYDKNGTALQTFSLASFFGVLSGYSEFDPRLAYDAPSGRWFATLVSLRDNATGSDAGRLHVAVSETDDPTGTWNVYSLSYVDVFPDQPAFGLSDDKFTVSSNIFDVDGPPGPITAGCDSSGYCGDEIVVIQKSDLLAGVSGSSLQKQSFPYDLNSFTIRPAVSLSSVSDQYLATFSISSSHMLRMLRISGTPAGGDVAIAATTNLSVLSNVTPPSSATGGSGGCILGTHNVGPPPCIDSGDERVLNAVWRDDRLWTTSTSACRLAGDSTTRACAHLIEVDTSATPSVRQDIMYGASGQYYSYPAATVDSSDDLYVVLSHTNTSIFAEASLAGRLAGDSLNTLSTATVLHAGNVVQTSGRWGDYLGAAIDPSATGCAWVVGEYSGAVSGPNWDWATDIGAASFDGSCPSPPGATPTPTQTPTRIATPTRTPTSTRTPTRTHTPGPSPTPINTHTPAPTTTPIAPTFTPTGSPTPTPTAVEPTATPTITPEVPTATPTVTPGAATDTPTVTATFTLVETPTPTPTPAGLIGDANKDGAVNAIDAALVLQYSAGLLSAINPNADATQDGEVNAIDAAVILQYVAGLIGRLPP